MVFAYSEYDGICQFLSQLNQKEYRHWNVTYSRPAQSLFIQKNSNELLMGALEFHRCIKWLKFQLTLSQLCSGRQEVRKQLQCGLSSMMGEAPISQRASNSCITWVDCCWCSVATLRLTLCNPMDCSAPGFPVLHYLVEFAQSHVHRVGDAIQPSHPLSSPSPPAFNLSQHQGFFSNESVLHIRWPKYWSFSLSISPSNEYSGLMSFRIDWFDPPEWIEGENYHLCSHTFILNRALILLYRTPTMTLFKSNHPFYIEIPSHGGLGPQQYEFEETHSVHNMYISRNIVNIYIYI